MRTSIAALASAALLTCLTACSGTNAASDGEGAIVGPGTTVAPRINNAALITLMTPDGSATQSEGLSYDTKRVPPGAKMAVHSSVADGRTIVELEVSGLLPGTKYGAHVHTKPCGAKPADSGPHYQNEKDPVTPSVDPKYANATNEIWLDFATDAEGAVTTSVTVDWQFRKGEANSVVLHALHTSTEHGKAGTAGDRLACLTAQF